MAIKKIGLLGGSFDPVHLAHIALAETARRTLDLEEVQLIPAADPWQRSPLAGTGEQRLAMREIATQKQSILKVKPVDSSPARATCASDTLRQFRPNLEYY